MSFNRFHVMGTVQLPNDILLSRAEAFLNEGREVVIRAKGSSMLPFIHGDRDSVVLKKCDDLSVGDIVLVRLPGRYVMHRIISISQDIFVMMGDGNVTGTEVFRRGDVLGKVIWIVREDGRHIKPGNGRLWRKLLPIRRYLLAVYRRLFK